MTSYKVEVLARGESAYCSNALRFATDEEANRYGYDLSGRWLAVKDWRIAATNDPVTARFEDGRVIHLELGEKGCQ